MQKNQKGFTIIELLIVIVIIGILVALALPNLFAAQARGRDSDRKADIKTLQTSLETYYNDNGSYPESLADLDPAPAADVLADKKGNNYTYTSDGDTYTLSTTLENTNDPDATGENGAYVKQSTNQ